MIEGILISLNQIIMIADSRALINFPELGRTSIHGLNLSRKNRTNVRVDSLLSRLSLFAFTAIEGLLSHLIGV